MKVGILSMHRVINYGSFLQAYALKQLLLQHGAGEVTFIDIKPGRALKGFEVEASKISRIFRIVKYALCGKFLSKIRNRRHQTQTRKCLESHYPLLAIDVPPQPYYDLVVIGSDEVFNCCQKARWGYTLQLYGDIPEAKRVISYAGSFGHTQYEQLVERSIDKEIGETMKKLSAISVRDDNSLDIVKRLTGIEATVHLDPVLAYGYQAEVEQATLPKDKDYIVVYAYPGRIKDKAEIEAIRDFAKKHNKKLYSFTYYGWCDKSISPSSPFEVLNWFKGADYVITDTFHGTIFSVITHREFATIIRPSNRNKIGSLLKTLGLSARGTDKLERLDPIFASAIDYGDVDLRLSEQRKNVHSYLSSNVAK